MGKQQNQSPQENQMKDSVAESEWKTTTEVTQNHELPHSPISMSTPIPNVLYSSCA
jgi:hypothetical protein